MLTRNSQIGEFYVMAPPQVKPKGENGMHTCDIMIFDEERDAHVRIGWREALEASLCAQGSAFLTKYGGTKVAGAKGEGDNLTAWATAADAWADYNDAKSNDYEGLDKDVRIIVARPFIECVLLAPPNLRLGVAAHRPCLTCVQALDAQRHHVRGGP